MYKPLSSSGSFKVTMIHQGYELYGSDRTFLQSIEALHDAYPDAIIDVVLPASGRLVAVLEQFRATVLIDPHLLVIRRAQLASLFKDFVHYLWSLRVNSKSRARVEILYVNTVVLLGEIIFPSVDARIFVIHIHEIPGLGVRLALSLILRVSGAKLIFNSVATRAAFGFRSSPDRIVVLNGVSGPPFPVPSSSPRDRGARLKVLMVGRLNHWKGQDVLLEAALKVAAPLDIKIVGDAFVGQEAIRASLDTFIEANKMRSFVEIVGFQTDPSPYYSWADVVVVPSKQPEPFGRVAIEAMSFAKPLVATDAGGLREIVIDGETGYLVEPNNSTVLASALQKIADEPEVSAQMGLKGRLRYENQFSEEHYKSALVDAINTWRTQ